MGLAVAPVVELPPIIVGAASPSFDPVLISGWVLASLAFLGFGIASAIRVSRMRARWRMTELAGHQVLVPQLIKTLREAGGEDILVVVGGVVPPKDHRALIEVGVAAIYPPGTNITEAAHELLSILGKRRGDRAA